MSLLTLLLAGFTVILYLFLFLVKREVQIKATSSKKNKIAVVVISVAIIALLVSGERTADERVRGVLAGIIFFSFLFDTRGMAEDRFVLNPFDLRGVPYKEVDRVVLYQESEATEIKMNFFRFGMRGPLMKFETPLEEMVTFLAAYLNKGTTIDILTDKQQS